MAGPWISKLLLIGCCSYSVLLCGWLLLQRTVGDRWWWLFFLNLFAVYLFSLLPLVLLIAWRSQQPLLWAASGLAVALALLLYGPAWWPHLAADAADSAALTVMTFNALAYRAETQALVTAIRQSQADLVAIQELNLAVGAALQTQLLERYPYQVLNPQADSRGMGVISRYPLQAWSQSIAGAWLGPPQILQVEWSSGPFLLINCHAISVQFSPKRLASFLTIHQSVPERERQMQALAAFAAQQTLPVVAVGDFNTSEQTRAYRLLTQVLGDAWQAGGWGFGHTFPGALSPASSRAVFWGIPVPQWLIRIDYIFHSAQWQTVRAWIGPWDEVSDHRPVMAQLRLRPNR